MCNDCSSSSSSPADPQLFKWMTNIGIVKTDAEDNDDDDVVKKCSCCDGVINPISKDSSLDFVIKGRELLGDLFSDQKVQVNSDQSDDLKFGYQVLGDGAEEEDGSEEDEDMILETEKEPLLDTDNNNNDIDGKNKENLTTEICLDMLPQHLEFYIDHDDYRLIPVDMNHGNSIKVVGEEEKRENSELSREFELVFEGDELVFPGCKIITSKDLPCIQEEEQSVTENLQVSKDEEKKDCSEKFELVFEGDDLLQKEEETIIKNLQMSNDVEKMNDLSKFELDFGNYELLQEEEETIIENLHIPKDEEKIDDSSKFELVFDGDKFVAECEIISASSPKEEVESATDNLQNRQDNPHNREDGKEEKEEEEEEDDSQIPQPLQMEEKKREIDHSLFLKEQEDTATVECTAILDEKETDDETIEADIQAIVQTTSTPAVSKEDDASLETDESDTEEKNQNPTDNILLIEEFKEDTASHLRSQESRTITANVESEVSASYPHDAEISEVSQNSKVGMSHNEVDEEKVPDTPTSSESLSHLNKKLFLLGRRESATEESLDGMSMISEQESTETMEKLKVDLLSERKTLRALYKELEEERNASAIAANQTMAMITRLQEEKATMQMEALQYQRMMEEQSEYDQEALQMMNELVIKREKEKQELEKELEAYRKKVMDYEEREKLRMLCRRRSRNSSASCSYGEESDGLSIDLNHEVKEQEEESGSPHSHEENGHQDTPADAVLCLQDSLTGFEDERQAILGQLKVLEEKLFTLAEEEEEHFDNTKPFEQFYEENGKDFEGNGDDSNGFIHVNGKHQQEKRMNGSMPKRLLPLFDAVELSESPNGELNGNGDHDFHITKFELEKKRFAIEEEVDHVYERLQSLEADREFLKHCIGSLRKGDKGLDLLQEILQHLRDLKNVEIQAMKNTDQCASV
ncbi:hypothetical protein BVRB_5g119270 [Beta vulgaris subsp. vulgaris]|nr:hypothetical protein BVRB_5g119270 [Beta vulgaris subsp. vulgaris]